MRASAESGCPDPPTEINEAVQSSSVCISTKGVRVREVSEINEDKETDPSQSAMKRRHGQDPGISTNGKKSKISTENENDEVPSSCTGLGNDKQEENVDDEELTDAVELAKKNVAELNNNLDNSSSSQNSMEHGKESNKEDNPSTTCAGVLVQVKLEDVNSENGTVDSGASTSHTIHIKPSLNVKKEEATSTSRESCKYGIRCYRRNPMHRLEQAHPGDHDYKRPNYPLPPLGTPDCPFGDSCYRRNPAHFEQFSHPPETDFEKNWKNYQFRLRQRRQKTQNDLNSSNNDYNDLSSDSDDYEDPFIDDSELDEDYTPSDNDDEDEEYDECDKAEE